MASPLLQGPPPFPIARFSVEQYHRMIASGAFTEDDRIELIEGWVVQKMAKGPAHEYSTGQTEELVRDRLPAGWHVRNQAPITLADSEPEPDLAVVRGSREDYRRRHPGASDVALIIEISDTTLGTDRLKARTYGAAGIVEYWIVNLVDRCVETYKSPSQADARGYTVREVLREDAQLALVIGDAERGPLDIRALLP